MKIKPVLDKWEIKGIQDISTTENRALVEHKIPGLAGSILQDMGESSTSITIMGTLPNVDDLRDEFLEEVRKKFIAGNPVPFMADITTETDVKEVIIADFQVKEVAGSAEPCQYIIKLTEYIPPPEPPAATAMAGIQMDIDLEAGDLIDGLADNISLIDDISATLGSIPDFGDPTKPLENVLEEVNNATKGLDEAVIKEIFGEKMPEEATTSRAGLLSQIPDTSQVGNLINQVSIDFSGVTGNISNLPTGEISSLAESLGGISIPDSSSLIGNITSGLSGLTSRIPTDPSELFKPITSEFSNLERLLSSDILGQLRSIPDRFTNITQLIENPEELLGGILGPFEEIQRVLAESEIASSLTSFLEILEELKTQVESETGQLQNLIQERINHLLLSITSPIEKAVRRSGIRFINATLVAADIEAKIQDTINAFSDSLLNQIRNLNISNETQFSTLIHGLNAVKGRAESLAALLNNTLSTANQGLDSINIDTFRTRIEGFLSKINDIEVVQIGDLTSGLEGVFDQINEFINNIDMDGIKTQIEEFLNQIKAKLDEIDLNSIKNTVVNSIGTATSALDNIDRVQLEVTVAVRNFFQEVKDVVAGIDLSVVQNTIQSVLNGIQTGVEGLETAINSINETIDNVLNSIKEGLQGVKTFLLGSETQKGVKQQLEDLLNQIYQTLVDLNIQEVLKGVRAKLDEMLSSLDEIDFDPVVDPVIEQIDNMRGQVSQIDVSALNDLLKMALNAAVEVIKQVDFDKQITQVLMEELNEIKGKPEEAVEKIKEKFMEVLNKIEEFNPTEKLLKGLQEEVFEPLMAELEKIKPSQLLKPIEDGYNFILNELEKIKPSELLSPLTDLYDQLLKSFRLISPSKLVEPLEELLQKLKDLVNQIDITPFINELKTKVETITSAINNFSLVKVLEPVTDIYNQIKAKIDEFDPTRLLEPVTDLLDPILSAIDEIDLSPIEEVFNNFKTAIDQFNPDGALAIIQTQIDNTTIELNKFDIMVIISTLRLKHQAFKDGLNSITVPDNLIPRYQELETLINSLSPVTIFSSLSISFDGCQVKLNGLGGNFSKSLQELSSSFDTAKEKLDELIPDFVKEGRITKESIKNTIQQAIAGSLIEGLESTSQSIKNLFEDLNPASIITELDELVNTVKDKVTNFLDPTPVTDAIETAINTFKEKVNNLSVSFLKDELEGFFDEIENKIKELDPAIIVNGTEEQPGLAQLYEDALNILKKIDPGEIGKRLDKIYDEDVLALLNELNPEKVLIPPLKKLFDNIMTLLRSLDIDVVFRPLLNSLDQLSNELKSALARTSTAFKGMISAIPV